MAEPVIPKTRYDIMRALKNYFLSNPDTKGYKIVLGDAMRVQGTAIGIIWSGDQNINVYTPSSDVKLFVEVWVYTKDPDPEKPYALLEPIQSAVHSALLKCSNSNAIGKALGINLSMSISDEDSDANVFAPFYASRLSLSMKWNKLGRSV